MSLRPWERSARWPSRITSTKPELWAQLPHDGKESLPGNGVHIALECESPSMVNAVYEAAMAKGASDNGQPGPRPDYGKNYYAAFFIDLCGNKIEAIYLPQEEDTEALH